MVSSGDGPERELSDTLEDEFGYFALPSGGSGGGTPRPRPDVTASRAGDIYVIESKKSKDGTVSLDPHEIPELIDCAERAGGTAVLAIKPDQRRSEHDQWYCYDATTIEPTESGGYYVGKKCHDRAQSIAEFFGGDP